MSDALTWIDMVGWCATLVFVGSYFCRQASALRRMQMLGAFMWVAYGALVGAAPVVAANLLVVGAAAWTARRSSAPKLGASTGGVVSAGS